MNTIDPSRKFSTVQKMLEFFKPKQIFNKFRSFSIDDFSKTSKSFAHVLSKVSYMLLEK